MSNKLEAIIVQLEAAEKDGIKLLPYEIRTILGALDGWSLVVQTVDNIRRNRADVQ